MTAEAVERFACFGGTCEVRVAGAGAASAAQRARERLLELHARFTRFDPASELSRLNADPRPEVPASATMRALAGVVRAAGERTGGLVDGTLARELAAAVYACSAPGAALPPALALRLAPRRRPAGPAAGARWRHVHAGPGSVHRPPGVALDGGGLAKGLFATSSPPTCATSPRSSSPALAPCASAAAHAPSTSPIRSREPGSTRSRPTPAAPPPRASPAAPGSAPTGARRTTCSTLRPAGPPTPASSRSRRSRRPRWTPRSAPRPRCSAARRPRRTGSRAGGVVVHDDGGHRVYVATRSGGSAVVAA